MMYKMAQEYLKQQIKNKLQQMLKDLLLNPESLAGLMSLLKFAGIDINQLPGMVGKLDGLNPYQVLGLEETATDEEVRTRFRERTKLFHPDTSSIPGSTYLFQMTLEAYRQISAKRGWS